MEKLLRRLLKFLTDTYCDSRGVPDGGRVSQFVCIGLLVVMVMVGLYGQYHGHDCWAPAYIFITVAAIATGQSLASAYENAGKNRAEADELIARAQALAPAAGASAPLVGSAEQVIVETPPPAVGEQP